MRVRVMEEELPNLGPRPEKKHDHAMTSFFIFVAGMALGGRLLRRALGDRPEAARRGEARPDVMSWSFALRMARGPVGILPRHGRATGSAWLAALVRFHARCGKSSCAASGKTTCTF
ncbi:MAG: hypothetical protein MZV70_04810 [Desulfobacterales bacterium]|nr:hypothetical protein [Desulfobacterales bacterium]